MAAKTRTGKSRKNKKSSNKKFSVKLKTLLISTLLLLIILIVKENFIDKQNFNFKQKFSEIDKSILNRKQKISKNIEKKIYEAGSDIKEIGKTVLSTKESNKLITSSETNENLNNNVISDNWYSSQLKDVKYLYNPQIPTNISSQIIEYEGYTVSFNKDYKIANWVGYELTGEETVSKVKRINKFIKDVNAINCPVNSDYAKSGYDRGHMAPAADMAWNDNVMKESFYFTNMTPQEPSFNRGIWKNLEDKCRDWAVRDSAIIIITGPIVNGDEKKIGKNQVLVPDYFFKIILSPFKDKPYNAAFLIKNEGSLLLLQDFMVSIDSIEKLTGYDFFHILPSELQKSFESSIDKNYWFN